MRIIKSVKQNRKNFKSKEVKIRKIAYNKIFKIFINESTSIYSESHIRNFKKSYKIFVDFLKKEKIYSFTKLNTYIMVNFISYISKYKMKYRQVILSAIRSFFRFLYLSQYTQKDLSFIVPKLRSIQSNNIPHTIWSEKEIKSILNVINTNSPVGKRNFAMLTLMSYLGLRLVDVKYLKFSNIDWKNNKIKLIQHKTKKYIELPLLNNIGDALIDYIKNGRPNYESPYIFLSHKPIGKISMSNNFYSYFLKYLSLANIDISNRSLIGVHSLRHSLASTLLQNKVNLSTISLILGHTNPDNTSIYLKTDIINLRKCCIQKEGI